MIDNLETSDDKEVRQLSLDVIVAVEGERREDREITQIVLKRALAKQADPAKRARLQAALASLHMGQPAATAGQKPR